MLRTLLHQTGVQQVQSMYTHRSKERLERDARFFSPAPHTRRACEARALRAREALTLLFCPVNQF